MPIWEIIAFIGCPIIWVFIFKCAESSLSLSWFFKVHVFYSVLQFWMSKRQREICRELRTVKWQMIPTLTNEYEDLVELQKFRNRNPAFRDAPDEWVRFQLTS